ncbi:MAG: BamA/TamA family outer membrane protein [Tunicatimonas sp.]
MAGCAGTRYLSEGEYLLHEQEIKGTRKIDAGDLDNFYRQEPNSKLPLLPVYPYVQLYQMGLKRYDKEELRQEEKEVIQRYDKKIEAARAEGKENKVKRLARKKENKVSKIERELKEGNLLMRWGEPLAIYDSSLAETTRAQMESYLHTKGYFNGIVEHDTEVNGKKVTSVYQVQEQAPYRIDTVVYRSDDKDLLALIESNLDERIIQQGQIYDQDKFGQERERIENFLKNRGYYDFSRQYVDFSVDSTVGERAVRVYTNIKEPAKRGYHKAFRIDSVIFTTDADVKGAGQRQTGVYNNITYRYYEYEYYKKILDRRIFLYPDSLYSRDATLATQRQLSNLNTFKFININYDTTGGNFIANIYASPLKKFQTANEIGLNVSQGIPGPFVNASLQVKNVFGGLEILEISGRAGIEGVPPVTEVGGGVNAYRSVEMGGNLALTFPQFVFPLPTRLKSRLGRLNPKTRVQTGYSYTDRPEFIRENFKTTLSYNWQKGQKVLYSFTPVDVNFINSAIQSEAFQDSLDNDIEIYGFPLSRSFEPSFVSSMSFTTIFNFNDYGSSQLTEGVVGTPTYLKLYAEAGGTILNFFGTNLLEEAGLEYFKYVKLNTDFRQYINLDRDNTLAYRFNAAVAVPYGTNERALPYEKYFFAAGSNSIRGWIPRRLGPGSASPRGVDSDGYFQYNLEQPGEVLLETSVELRSKLFGFVNGALFVDAGNIWRLQDFPDDADTGEPRPGAAFGFDTFWNQIAIGSGIGLRFDFSFLIFRLDYGVKVYDPARDISERWIGQKFDVWSEIVNGQPYIGIGYPF